MYDIHSKVIKICSLYITSVCGTQRGVGTGILYIYVYTIPGLVTYSPLVCTCFDRLKLFIDMLRTCTGVVFRDWLSCNKMTGLHYAFKSHMSPVRITRVVLLIICYVFP
jgi:hypothetical protein